MRLQDNIQAIYKIHWLNSPIHYIGSTCDPSNRFNIHKSAFKRNKHYNKLMQESFNLYGMPDFTIIEYCKEKDVALREYYNGCLDKDNCCSVIPKWFINGEYTKIPNPVKCLDNYIKKEHKIKLTDYQATQLRRKYTTLQSAINQLINSI